LKKGGKWWSFNYKNPVDDVKTIGMKDKVTLKDLEKVENILNQVDKDQVDKETIFKQLVAYIEININKFDIAVKLLVYAKALEHNVTSLSSTDAVDILEIGVKTNDKKDPVTAFDMTLIEFFIKKAKNEHYKTGIINVIQGTYSRFNLKTKEMLEKGGLNPPIQPQPETNRSENYPTSMQRMQPQIQAQCPTSYKITANVDDDDVENIIAEIYENRGPLLKLDGVLCLIKEALDNKEKKDGEEDEEDEIIDEKITDLLIELYEIKDANKGSYVDKYEKEIEGLKTRFNDLRYQKPGHRGGTKSRSSRSKAHKKSRKQRRKSS
jgi:hypothetical protein